VDPATAACVVRIVSAAHPGTANNPDCAAANDDPAACIRCYRDEGVLDAVCGAARGSCLDGGAGAGGAGGGGGGEAVEDCTDLCALAPVNDDIADCVAEYVAIRHPAVLGVPACQNANQPATCQSCYDAADVADATCVGAWSSCF
jgi:hypothetical protein